MSYLTLSSINMADISKGTISLWFRLSQDSIDKAALYRSEKTHPKAPGVLDITIPLVTFGRKVMAKVYDSVSKTFTAPVLPDSTAPPPTITAAQVDEVDGDFPCAPSHIGIICDGETPTLVMKFQTETRAAVQGLNGQVTNVTWTLPPGALEYEPHQTIDDVSYIQVGEPETFLIVPTFKVDVDKWHHLLVSFDFSTNVDVVAFEGDAATDEELRDKTIKSFCKVWFAFDDENKKGKDNIGNNFESSFRPVTGWVTADENGVITMNAEAAVFTYTKAPEHPGNDNRVAASPEYHWTASPIPTEHGPMGLPASAEYVETIYHCEMAEFQLFTGVTLDTGEEKNRRAFVDTDGKPVPPDKKKDPTDPTSRSGSIELLGKRPDVMLHKSSNWKIGKNTGTLGLDINTDGEETIIPSGQFIPIAKIEPYKPEPALEEATP